MTEPKRRVSALPPKEARLRKQDPFQDIENVVLVPSSQPSTEQLAALSERQALAYKEWKASIDADAQRRERVLLMKGSMNRPGC